MEIKGRITHVLPEQTGEGKNGQWRKGGYVMELPGTYPKSVCFDVWGANIDAFGIKQNDEVIASIDIESREYNGKWYTNVKAWKVVKDQPQEHTASVSAPPTDQSWPTPSDEVKSTPADGDFDDLPF